MQYIIPAVLCALISLTGAFTQRVSGFGYGIIVMMIFPHLISYGAANTLSGLISLFSAAYVAFSMRKHIKLSQLPIPLITYTLLNYLATSFVASADTSLLKRILGGALIVLSVYFFAFSKKIKLKPTIPSALGAGAVSGTMSGLFAMGGPPMVLYFMSTNSESTDDYLGTIQAFFALSNIISTSVRASKGLFTEEVFIMFIPALAGMLLGNFLGRKVYTRLRPAVIKKCVYAFMAVSGAITLIMG